MSINEFKELDTNQKAYYLAQHFPKLREAYHKVKEDVEENHERYEQLKREVSQ